MESINEFCAEIQRKRLKAEGHLDEFIHRIEEDISRFRATEECFDNDRTRLVHEVCLGRRPESDLDSRRDEAQKAAQRIIDRENTTTTGNG